MAFQKHTNLYSYNTGLSVILSNVITKKGHKKSPLQYARGFSEELWGLLLSNFFFGVETLNKRVSDKGKNK